MSGPASRRGFLRGLTTLPLIGGSVALIGAPSAVAAPVTTLMLEDYVSFLAWEHREAIAELHERRAREHLAGKGIPEFRDGFDYPKIARQDAWERAPMWWFPESPGVKATVSGDDPSTRAAVVLSAVGLGWRTR